MSKRYEKEIEEILGRSGPIRVPPQRSGQSLPKLLLMYANRRLGGLWSLSPGRVMLAGVGLVIAALIVRIADSGLSVPIGVVGIVVLVAGYALAVIRPASAAPPKSGNSGTTGKTWRGRPIDGDTEDRDFWNR